MSKPFTAQDLSDQFDADLNWRRKELSDLKASIRAADSISRSALLRALVAMTYAHWEGYVKFCAERFFLHITMRKMPYSTLVQQFYVNSFSARLDALSKSKVGLAGQRELISSILNGLGQRFVGVNTDLIDTGSNLKTDQIRDICLICDVDGSHFEERRVFIDQILLKRRNAIAHGQWEVIDESEMDGLIADALALMSHFRTLLENKIYTNAYRAA